MGTSDIESGPLPVMPDFPQLQDPSIRVNEDKPTKDAAKMAWVLLRYASESWPYHLPAMRLDTSLCFLEPLCEKENDTCFDCLS